MKILTLFLALALSASMIGISYAEEDAEDNSTAGKALGGAVMGGLLGGGLGAAIGSASGHAGKGALIGAGVGAVGGTLLGASQESKRRAAKKSEITTREEDVENAPTANTKVKKRIVREYDDQGNVVSEKEVRE